MEETGFLYFLPVSPLISFYRLPSLDGSLRRQYLSGELGGYMPSVEMSTLTVRGPQDNSEVFLCLPGSDLPYSPVRLGNPVSQIPDCFFFSRRLCKHWLCEVNLHFLKLVISGFLHYFQIWHLVKALMFNYVFNTFNYILSQRQHSYWTYANNYVAMKIRIFDFLRDQTEEKIFWFYLQN